MFKESRDVTRKVTSSLVFEGLIVHQADRVRTFNFVKTGNLTFLHDDLQQVL